MQCSKALGRALVMTTALVGARAQAETPPDQPFDFGPQPGWIMMLGPTFGGSFGSGGGGGYLGAELSLTRLSMGNWVGLYVDGVYDFGRGGEPMFTAGPQLGSTLVGIDGGGALRLVDSEPEFGATGRLLLSLIVADLYGRYAYFVDSGDHQFQVGLMIKLPVWASETTPPGGGSD